MGWFINLITGSGKEPYSSCTDCSETVMNIKFPSNEDDEDKHYEVVYDNGSGCTATTEVVVEKCESEPCSVNVSISANGCTIPDECIDKSRPRVIFNVSGNYEDGKKLHYSIVEGSAPSHAGGTQTGDITLYHSLNPFNIPLSVDYSGKEVTITWWYDNDYSCSGYSTITLADCDYSTCNKIDIETHDGKGKDEIHLSYSASRECGDESCDTCETLICYTANTEFNNLTARTDSSWINIADEQLGDEIYFWVDANNCPSNVESWCDNDDEWCGSRCGKIEILVDGEVCKEVAVIQKRCYESVFVTHQTIFTGDVFTNLPIMPDSVDTLYEFRLTTFDNNIRRPFVFTANTIYDCAIPERHITFDPFVIYENGEMTGNVAFSNNYPSDAQYEYSLSDPCQPLSDLRPISVNGVASECFTHIYSMYWNRNITGEDISRKSDFFEVSQAPEYLYVTYGGYTYELGGCQPYPETCYNCSKNPNDHRNIYRFGYWTSDDNSRGVGNNAPQRKFECTVTFDFRLVVDENGNLKKDENDKPLSGEFITIELNKIYDELDGTDIDGKGTTLCD